MSSPINHNSKMEKKQEQNTSLGLADRLNEAFNRKVAQEADRGRRYTKAMFARRMDETPQTIQHWLQKGAVEKMKLPRVAKEFGVSVEWLIDGTEPIDLFVAITPKVKALIEIYQRLDPADQERIFQEILQAERRKREEIDNLINRQ